MKKWYLLPLSFSLFGCVSLSNLEKNATLDPKSDDTIVVIGVKPAYRVAIKAGNLQDGKYVFSPNLPASANSVPDNGYIVAKLPKQGSNQRYAITQMLPEGITGPRVRPCNGLKTVAFDGKPGRVVYLGDLSYMPAGASIVAQYDYDFQRAKRFLENNYVNLKDRLEEGKLEIIEVTNMPCDDAPRIQWTIRS